MLRAYVALYLQSSLHSTADTRWFQGGRVFSWIEPAFRGLYAWRVVRLRKSRVSRRFSVYSRIAAFDPGGMISHGLTRRSVTKSGQFALPRRDACTFAFVLRILREAESRGPRLCLYWLDEWASRAKFGLWSSGVAFGQPSVGAHAGAMKGLPGWRELDANCIACAHVSAIGCHWTA